MQIYGTADLKMKEGRTAETSAGNAMRHLEHMNAHTEHNMCGNSGE